MQTFKYTNFKCIQQTCQPIYVAFKSKHKTSLCFTANLSFNRSNQLSIKMLTDEIIGISNKNNNNVDTITIIRLVTIFTIILIIKSRNFI
jgi:hypothetical protein